MSLLALAAVAALTGCANDTGGKPVAQAPGKTGGQSESSTAPSGGVAPPGETATPPSRQELLGQEDLPPGARIQELDIATMAKQFARLAGSAKIEPAECGKLATQVFEAAKTAGGSPTGVGMVALARGSSISESILLRPGSFGLAQNEQLLRKCRTMRTTIGNQTTTAHTEPLRLAGVNAEQVSGYRQETTMPGGRGTLTTLAATMTSKGRIVTVSMSGARPASEAELTALANKALSKANG